MATYACPYMTDEDLEEVSGYERNQSKKHIDWLTRNRVPFTLRRDGKPRTTWGMYEQAMANQASGEVAPNFDFLRQRSG